MAGVGALSSFRGRLPPDEAAQSLRRWPAPAAAPVRRLLTWLASLALGFLLAIGGLLVAASDSVPLVARGATIAPTSVDQARRLFTANDPRWLARGEERQMAIPAALIDEAVNYLASRRWHGRGALALAEETAEVQLTVRVIAAPVTRYVNLRATIRAAEGEPRIDAAFVGRVPIPAALVEFALVSAMRASGYEREWTLARHAIRRLAFAPARQNVVVNYVWEPAILEGARAIALNPDDLARLRTAQTTLAALLDHHAAGAKVPLPGVLKAMMATSGEPPRAERRAALLVLATYLAETRLRDIVPEARYWPRPRLVKLTLRGRYDSAQHFAVSAALAAWAGEPMADAIGVYKELDDARHGSGFSFADLAADRAGTRFGELVAGNAEHLDQALAGDLADADLAPALSDLPEYLYQPEFARRFGGPGSPAYQRVAAEIERRLAALPLYR
jgi:uncharacterized protein YfiM (DUF2279 family)